MNSNEARKKNTTGISMSLFNKFLYLISLSSSNLSRIKNFLTYTHVLSSTDKEESILCVCVEGKR